MKFLLGALVGAASVQAQQYESIAGYAPASDVVQHNNIDQDLDVLASSMKLFTNQGWATAADIYANGNFSTKSSGMRTIQGFSTAALSKMKGETTFSKFHAYHGGKLADAAYADVFVRAAIDGTIAPGSPIARKEMATKGAAYQVIWMYAVHEFFDAVADCFEGDITSNDRGVHAFDEGVAFYTGSKEGTVLGGNKATAGGNMPYRLAEKRCANFATCTDTGISSVNLRLFQHFDTTRDDLQAGRCQTAQDTLEHQIVPLMTVPLIQGTLRYAFKNDPDVFLTNPKQRAEGWAFASAVLPLVGFCDTNAASLVAHNMAYDDTREPVPDGHKKVFAALEKVLPCLELTCEDIGAYQAEGAPAACITADLIPAQTKPIAGYTPGSDVVQHSRVDLDVLGINQFLKVYDFKNAAKLYLNGHNSKKSSSTRNLQAFTNNNQKLKGEPMMDMYAAYYNNDYHYAHVQTMHALDGTGFMNGAAEVARKEIALKTMQYHSVWMYTLHELEDAVGDCRSSTITDNDAGVHAWDEGWAFYAGSLEGETGSGAGQSLYALADKRCANFGTCTTTGHAFVNDRLLELYTKGKVALQKGQCQVGADVLDLIKPLMTVPLIQGALRYAYKASDGRGGAKEQAEGWAFTSAVLPQIDAADADAATLIRENMQYPPGPRGAVPDGYREVFRTFQSVYAKLRLTCADVGGLLAADGVSYYPGTAPCPDLSTKPHKTIELHGSGATGASKLNWKYAELLEERLGSPLMITYRAVGTSNGKSEFGARANHFTCADSALSSQARKSYGAAHMHFPYAQTKVSIFHNIPSENLPGSLNLSPSTLAKIMQRSIRTWDHPVIKAENPDLVVQSSQPIYLYRREAGAASTALLAAYLNKAASNDWRLGLGDDLNWPNDAEEVEGTNALAQKLSEMSFAIGYVETDQGGSYALAEVPMRSMGGTYQLASQATSSTKGLTLPASEGEWADVSLMGDANSNSNSWPMTGLSYVIVPTDLRFLGETGHLIKAYLEFVLSTEGQQLAKEFGYGSLPADVQLINSQGLQKLEVDESFAPFGWEYTTNVVSGAQPRVFSTKRRQYSDLTLEKHTRDLEALEIAYATLKKDLDALLGKETPDMDFKKQFTCEDRCGKKGSVKTQFAPYTPSKACYCDNACAQASNDDCCEDISEFC